jgi:septal ring factor EnvC (AmiA/AmiB activator)
MGSLQGVIVPNMNHPIVKNLYGTGDPPYAIQSPAERDECFRKPTAMAAEPSVTTAGSLVHGDGGSAAVDSQLHRVCDSRIEDLQEQLSRAQERLSKAQEQLNKAQETIAARDGRIAELEGTLNEVNEVLGRQPGRKRVGIGNSADDV